MVEHVSTPLVPIFVTVSQEGQDLTVMMVSTVLSTHYHTIPHFDGLSIYSCRKHCEKRRNCLLQAISPFLTMFPTLYGTYFPF